MVEQQLRGRGITDQRVLESMGRIPREAFVEDDVRPRAYDDHALAIEQGQSISQPYMVARMTELLDPKPGDRILELGTGSGYQAAVLADLGASVISLERHAPLARQARQRIEALGLGHLVMIETADGSLGDPARGPYDGIVVTAAAPSVPQALRDQLTNGGRLVIPVGARERQTLTLVVRHGDSWQDSTHGYCVFVPLIGPGGFPPQDEPLGA